ncbi:putative secreted protein [Streptomyces scabiei 87.22]|uniref:Putative secreted protein n=1 Tax=Streptomyces scabiei (strain 87.22) TaxID=680198 RepID=C9ZF92_STRSW|nr:putative secreted protein [Streptomyces scabiei 87.22]
MLTGGAMAASGAGLGLGLAVGLVVGGVLLVTYCLLLADTGGGGP